MGKILIESKNFISYMIGERYRGGVLGARPFGIVMWFNVALRSYTTVRQYWIIFLPPTVNWAL